MEAADEAHPDAQPQPVGPRFVVEYTLQRLAIFGAVVLGVAWLLSRTSGSLWLNIPSAVLVVGALTWATFGSGGLGQTGGGGSWRTRRFDSHRVSQSWTLPGSAAGTQKADARWRDKVRAPLVEHAWETLCGSIIQEFVYDTWYSYLTPDREFPADIRRALNSAFGELSARARHVDLRAVLRDISELVMEQIDLFRYTRESIQRARAPGAPVLEMSSAAWDRALQQDMKAEGNLHPALCTPDGHYQVIRMVSEGLAAFVLDRSDSSKTMVRSVARELLGSCVLRNLMFYFTPYTINKLVLGLLQQQEVAEKRRNAEREQEQRRLMTSAKSESMKGHYDFEQRLRANIESEKMSAAQQRASKREARERLTAAAAHRRDGSNASTTVTSPGTPGEGLMEGYGSETSPVRASAGAAAAGATPAARQLGAESDQRLRPPEAYMQASAEAALADVALRGERMARSSQMGAQGAAGVMAAVGHEIADELRHPTEPAISRGTTEDEEAHCAHLRAPNQNGDEALSRADLEHVHRFIGRPRAKVVAAELTTGGSKDIVMFVIRVADDTGEWTIARRFRHFESVHRSLRGYPAYKLKLPPKRIFFHAVSADFVEERREQLDTYLRALLSDPNLCRVSEVWQFLSPWSDMYDLEDDGSFLRAVGTGLGTAKFNVKRFAGDIANEIEVKRKRSVAALARGLAPPPELPPGITLQSRSRSSKNLHLMASGGSGSRQQDRRASSVSSSPTRGGQDRSGSPPLPGSGPSSQRSMTAGTAGRIESISYNTSAVQCSSPAPTAPDHPSSTADQPSGSTVAQLPATPAGANGVSSITTANASGSSTAAAKAAGPAATVPKPGRADAAAAPGVIYGSGPNSGGVWQRSNSLVSGVAQRAGSITDDMGGLAKRAASATVGQGASMLHRAGKTASAGARNMASSLRQPDGGSKSGRSSPEPSQRAAAAAAAPATPSNAEAAQPGTTWNDRASSSALPHSGEVQDIGPRPDTDAGAGDGGHLECGVAPRTNSMPGGNLHAVDKSALKPERPAREGDGGGVGGLDWEDSAGISAPLYDIVDVVFELGSRGFFRRQIYAVGRQALSLVAGGAIDVFLLGQLRLLRQEHTLARAIHAIQAALWPGGTWFMYRPEYPRLKRTGTPAELALRPEEFLTDFTPPPIDEDEIREALAAALKSRAPPALIRLVGRQAYSSGVQDIFDMLQSPTFVLQLGYGILEICCVNVFPEMKALFRQMEHGVN